MNASQVLRKKMDTTLNGVIDIFIATKQTEGKSIRTTSWYRRRLKVFISFLGPRAMLKDITLNNARAFVAHLQTRETRYVGHPLTPEQEGKLSPATVHGYVRCVKVLTSWLADEGFLPTDVLAKLKRPKVPETMIEVLNESEIESIFATVKPTCALNARVHMICWLLLDTGIRASELCTLTLENTNLDQNYIKVFGKGSKERKVNFGINTKKHLMKYMTLWRPASEKNTLFLTSEGEPLTYSGLSQMIHRVGRRTGIPRLHAHLFRHTFAVRFLVNGGDLMTLKNILGHTEITTTQLYLKLTQQNIAEVYSKNSPMDRIDFRKK